MSDKTDDEDEILRDGQTKRFSLMMLDSCRPGFRYPDARTCTADSELAQQLAKNQEVYAYYKAAMQAEWRGGLVQGDIVDLGDRRCIVEGRDQNDGKVLLRAYDSQSLGDAREQAYAEYVHDLTHAWETK